MTESANHRLDFRAIFIIPLGQFAYWFILVILVSLSGYPGVVCITPMAWLIALRVGNQVTSRSKSILPKRRLTEAALAGGLLGLSQGVLVAILVPFMGPIREDELTKSIGLVLIMLVAGVWIGAGLSFFTAYLNESRRGGWQ